MRHSSVLPQSHNHRKQKNLRMIFLPDFSIVKFTNLGNLLVHSLILYMSIWKPEIILTCLFNDNPNGKNITIITFYGFFQALPIFLSIQSFMQIESNNAKQICLSLAFSDAVTIFAIKYGEMTEKWSVSVILIIISFLILFFSNLFSFLII